MSKRKPKKKLRELSRRDWFVVFKIAMCMALVSPLWLVEWVLRCGAYLYEKWERWDFLIDRMNKISDWAKK